MPTGLVCLSALRHISTRAAAIFDRYAPDEVVWVPATSFARFYQTLCWGDFADLDLHLLESFDPVDRDALLGELLCYHQYLRRQRERVDRFHHAYWGWLYELGRALPPEYVGRLRHWRQRFGTLAYFRITGLATRSGFLQFMTDPAGHMAAIEQAFADLAQQHSEFWGSRAEAEWFSGERRDEQTGLPAQIEQALRILALSADASLPEIRRAYRRRAKMLHPDWQGDKHSAQMAALNGAYQMLCAYHRPAAREGRSHGNEQ